MLKDKKILIKNLLARSIVFIASLSHQNNIKSVRETLEAIFNAQISN